ncbi:MAG: leucyl/phenylalanyl-tRNA--protein transferase [Mucilaginibacter sp.]|nr:leucyl/phenylalanyl-tRNA--protein transferase [Mucilaginibacter sp.]
MIFRLDDRIIFPDPALAEDDGLLAVGGDLSANRLLLAYQNGIFPWYSDDTPILWYSPHERFVLYPEELRISKSIQKVLQSGKFTVTIDKCFDRVIAACSAVKRDGQDGTWITEEMQTAYIQLHQKGDAHSIEVWHQNKLAGGLYGIQIGKIFSGESMFSLESNASKTALIHLCSMGYQLIDCQMHTSHLESMGARMISREEYMIVVSGSSN